MIRYYFIYLLLLFFQFIYSKENSKDNLLTKRKQIIEEISKNENLLKKVTNDKNKLLFEHELIKNKIRLREEMIENINKEIQDLNDSLNKLNKHINNLENELKYYKNEYAKILQNAYYREKYYNKYYIVFTSENFSKIYNRIYFLKNYFKNRENLIKKIKKEKNELELKNSEYLELLRMKENLLSQEKSQQEKLRNEMAMNKNLISDIKKREKEIISQINDLKRTSIKIEKEIKTIIDTEIKSSKRNNINEKERPKKVVKNRFIFPVRNGEVINEFGEKNHPLYKGIKIYNNGIDIATECNENVLSIDDGIVSKIFAIKGSNYVVIIRHDNFLSVYQNLYNIRISANEKIKKGSIIGNVFCSAEEKGAIFHFELWRENEKLDPLLFLNKN